MLSIGLRAGPSSEGMHLALHVGGPGFDSRGVGVRIKVSTGGYFILVGDSY